MDSQKNSKKNKTLIIRFSSFGDIAQALPCATGLAPQGEVHWLTRRDFAGFVQLNPAVHKVWSLERQLGLMGLLRLAWQLRQENFSHIYDAHSNLRSHLVCWILRCGRWQLSFARRSKERLKRILLFQFRLNLFPKPFRGAISYLAPIAKWLDAGAALSDSSTKRDRHMLPPPLRLQFSPNTQQKVTTRLNNLALENCVVFAPSATWELKRWPVAYWAELAQKITTQTILILAGPDDTFCRDIAAVAPTRVHNLAGQLSWEESTYVVAHAAAVIAGDTGLLHVADILGRPTVALIGPTAFGFPSRTTSHVAEVRDLHCRPCTKDGRGRCRNKIHQQCLRDVTPQIVYKKLTELAT